MVRGKIIKNNNKNKCTITKYSDMLLNLKNVELWLCKYEKINGTLNYECVSLSIYYICTDLT